MTTSGNRLFDSTLFCMVALLTLLSCSQRHQYSFAPGDVVPDNVLDTMDINTRFVCLEIPDTVFDLMCGRSYKDDCILSRSDLRYLLILHRNLEGKAVVGEMVVNKEIAADVLDIMEELFLKSYPIERVRLIDYYDADDEKSMAANNTTCFNWRPKSGSTQISKHALGLAIDINPLYNPYYKFFEGTETVRPIEGTPYIDRLSGYPYQIEEGDDCYNAFISHGFTWGGSWRSVTDYQHFEK